MRKHAKAPSAIVAASRGATRVRRTVFGIACLCVLGLTAFLGTGAPSVGAAETSPGQGFLPDNRAWEMVSPQDKNGGDIAPSSLRFKAADDGSAVMFFSRSGFGDIVGMNVGADYIAKRSADPAPGDQGWSTHAIMPQQEPMPPLAALTAMEAKYVGAGLSADLSRGVFLAPTPVTDAPNVAEKFNLYRRDDLLTPGPGSYELLTDCPAPPCEEPLPPAFIGFFGPRVVAGASADLSHVGFESMLPLTPDAPPLGNMAAYDATGGVPRLVGVLPDGSTAPQARIGQGVDPTTRTSHPVSSDGSRIVFTNQTSGGNTSATGPLYARINARSTVQLNASERTVPDSPQGAGYWDASADAHRVFFLSPEGLTDDAPADGQQKLYMWKQAETDETQSVAVDAAAGSFTLAFHGVSTGPIVFDASAASVQGALEALKGPAPEERPLIVPGNVSVSGGPGVAGGGTPYQVTFEGDFAGVNVAELSADGSALSGGASTASVETTQPVENLTHLDVDQEPGDGVGGPVEGVIGVSEDGDSVYFAASGQRVAGAPLLVARVGFFVWRDGDVHYIGAARSPFSPDVGDLFDGVVPLSLRVKQAQVTPDGNHLLLSSTSGEGLLSAHGGVDYDHAGFRQLYVYDTDSEDLQCASCNPSGAPATAPANVRSEPDGALGGAQLSATLSRSISDDGRYAFFSTVERLVPEDTNGVSDAYVYDTTTGKQSLLSSGESPQGSYFISASADGRDAFIATSERLSGWDFDQNIDFYDARVDGGFPEPPPPPPACVGDACQPAPLELNDPTPASSGFEGRGDQVGRNRKPRCPQGKRRVKARGGKSRCVKRKSGRRGANSNRRAGR